MNETQNASTSGGDSGGGSVPTGGGGSGSNSTTPIAGGSSTDPSSSVPTEEKKSDDTVPSIAQAFVDFYNGLGTSSDSTSAPQTKTVYLQPTTTSNTVLYLMLATGVGAIAWILYKSRHKESK